jgi:hypothetical protein
MFGCRWRGAAVAAPPSGEAVMIPCSVGECISMGSACASARDRGVQQRGTGVCHRDEVGTCRQHDQARPNKEWGMTDDPKNELDRDPQDNQFGKAAAEDQELADEVGEDGVAEDELADAPAEPPRAGDKAPLAGDSAS